MTYYFFPHIGGATWTAYNISKELERSGNKVLLLAPYIVGLRISRSNVGPLSAEFYSIDRYPIPKIIAPFVASFRNFYRAMLVLQREKFDFILVQYHPHHLNFPFGLLLARIFRLPLVVRADDIHRDMGTSETLVKHALVGLLNTLNEQLIRFSDLFLVVASENVKTLQHRRPEIPQCLLQISPNGFAPLDFNVNPCQKTCVNNKTVVFVGRFSGVEYGVGLLLEAIAIVIKIIPDVNLVLVGDSLSKNLRSIREQRGLLANVTIIPPACPNTVKQLIYEANVCIGPMLPTQSIPLKVLEYMASAKPVIAGINSISSDLAINGTNCLLVKPTSMDIAKAIIDLLTNPRLATQLGQNALTMVEKFSWANVIENMLNEIRHACFFRSNDN